VVDPKVRFRRRVAAAIALLVVLVAAVGMWAVGTGDGVSAPTATTSGGPSGSVLAVAASGRAGVVAGDDAHILAQGELPAVARVDYALFPRGDLPVAPGGRTWYVATTGDDGAPGSPDRTLRSIEAALRQAANGDTVYVRSGTYASTGLEVSRSRFLLSAYPARRSRSSPTRRAGPPASPSLLRPNTT